MIPCDLPPNGWTCTRDKGHPGPCAAWPAETPRLRVAALALCTPIRLHTMQVTTRPCDLCMADAADMLAALDANFDTAALRRWSDANDAIGTGLVAISTATVRALCDGYDEAARLREGYGAVSARTSELTVEASRLRTEVRRIEAEVVKWTEDAVAARQALADLAADLRALCDEWANDEWDEAPDFRDVRAVIDRHAPATSTTEEGR